MESCTQALRSAAFVVEAGVFPIRQDKLKAYALVANLKISIYLI